MTSTSTDDRGGFLQVLGAEVLEAGPDRAVVALECGPEHAQPHGVVHGGVHCALVETAASIGGHEWMGERGSVVGVSNQTDFLRPFTTGRLTATATPVHRGRSAQLWLVEIHAAERRLIARGQVRLHNLETPS